MDFVTNGLYSVCDCDVTDKWAPYPFIATATTTKNYCEQTISSLRNTSKANLDVDKTEHEMTRTSTTSLIEMIKEK